MRKKLFTILMSAMMMVTFMPAMAFAVGEIHQTFTPTSYAADYTTVTGYWDGNKEATDTLATVRTFKNTGMIQVTPSFAAYQGTIVATGDAAEAYYYDLDNATCTKTDYSATATKFSQDQFEAYFVSGSATMNHFVLKKPAYVDAADGENLTKVTVTGDASSDALKNYKVTVKMPATYVSGSYAEQKFDNLPVRVRANNEVKASATAPDTIGSLGTKNFTVLGKTASLGDVKFYLDKNTTAISGNAAITYDGAQHAIVDNKIPGVTFTYKLYNDETGKWDAVNNMTFQNAGDYDYEVTATLGKTTRKVGVNGVITVAPAEAKFELKNYASGNSTYEIFKGKQFDVYDFVLVNAVSGDSTKGVKAHAAELKGLFKGAYEIVETADEVVADKVNLTFKETAAYAAMTVAEKAAYWAQNANVTVTRDTDPTTWTASYTLVTPTDNELVACNETKTFHVKKAKALKKAKTFKMGADYVKYTGTATYFKQSGNSKIKIAQDGTVTVKKGLKKGTYKVKVKVKALGVSLPDTKVLKVKVVK